MKYHRHNNWKNLNDKYTIHGQKLAHQTHSQVENEWLIWLPRIRVLFSVRDQFVSARNFITWLERQMKGLDLYSRTRRAVISYNPTRNLTIQFGWAIFSSTEQFFANFYWFIRIRGLKVKRNSAVTVIWTGVIDYPWRTRVMTRNVATAKTKIR